MSENQTEQPPNEGTPSTEGQTRDDKGRFQSAPNGKTLPNSTPPPQPTENTPVKDALLDELEKDYREVLKDHPILKELDGMDQRVRIRMLRAVAKSETTTKKEEAINPMAEPPPTDDHIPTILELNRSDKYRADMRQQNSYVGMVQKYRSGKP